MSAAIHQQVLDRIDGAVDEMGDFLLQLGNLYAPVGMEEQTAALIHEWYQDQGIESYLVPIIEGRANVVGYVRGRRRGGVVFNAHLDTDASGEEYEYLVGGVDANILGASRDGDRFYGQTVLNDRHGHVLFMFAARALREAAVPLERDVILTSVAGETGQSPVDEYRGAYYAGKGLGTSFLVEHGIRARHAIVAETTEWAVCWRHCGTAYVKVTVPGTYGYTPRLDRAGGDIARMNPIVRATGVVDAIERWASTYTGSRTGPTECGTVRPNAMVGAIRSGLPWKPNRSARLCTLYVDVRVVPGEEPLDILDSMQDALDDTGTGARAELVMFKAGAIGTGIDSLRETITRNHLRVRDEPPPPEAEAAVVSMWRDTNVFNRNGIPAVNYGPCRNVDAQGRGYIDLEEVRDASKIYALTAMDLAGLAE